MKRRSTLQHKFAEFIPDKLEDGVLYVSTTYATASHRCCCGCGKEVVTPITPTDWQLTFDGESISLYPSIGNWSFPCQSHYWITRSAVRWAAHMTQQEIAAGRINDLIAKRHYFGDSPESPRAICSAEPTPAGTAQTQSGFWAKFKKLFS